jgi:hypothetical protein
VSDPTNLEYFDGLMDLFGIETATIAIGGFLPARQITAKGYVITFFFGDAGDYQDIGVVAPTRPKRPFGWDFMSLETQERIKKQTEGTP